VTFALSYRFRWAIGLLLRHTKTCRTRPCRGEAGYTKTRSWHATGLIPPGNWYLRWLSAGVHILPTKHWLDWESQMHAELSGLNVRRAGRRRLLLPRIAGERLAAILSSPVLDLSHKDRAIRLATAALVQAHQHCVLWPDGVSRPFSHGDATARNVLCDVASGRATWIDFETLHDPSRTVAWRQADDLRALIWSAAETTDADAYDVLCAAILNCVSDTEVLSELAHVAGCTRPNVYHLAQGSLSTAQHLRLCSVLAAAIAERQAQAP
jgi:hypothetical protein